MTDDPLVAEIRKIRHAHAAKFNNDITAICADIRRMEKESGRQYVNFPPRRPDARKEPSSMSDVNKNSMAEAPSDVLHLLRQHFETAYDGWSRIAHELKEHIGRLDDQAFLSERPVTKFILTWMRELSRFQTKFGKLVARKKQPSMSEEFTAAVALSLEQFLAARRAPGDVRSEETTHRERGALRPDISVRSHFEDRLVAIVECKTNLGYERGQWKANHEGRTAKLRESFPGCDPFLCVLSERNWEFAESGIHRNLVRDGFAYPRSHQDVSPTPWPILTSAFPQSSRCSSPSFKGWIVRGAQLGGHRSTR